MARADRGSVAGAMAMPNSIFHGRHRVGLAAFARIVLLSQLTLAGFAAPEPTVADLATRFAAPPETARPWLWWHWMNGNISAEGITKDLEAIHEVGAGGVILFEEANRVGPGPVRYFSPDHFAF